MKPLLVFYVSVTLASNIDEYMNTIRENVSELNEDYHMIFIPTNQSLTTKVECINPIFLPKDFYEKYMLKYEGKITCKLKEIENVKSKISN